MKYLDGHEVHQGALGTYVIGASVAQYKEKVKMAAPNAVGGEYDPFGNDGAPMDKVEEPQQPSVVLKNMFEVRFVRKLS